MRGATTVTDGVFHIEAQFGEGLFIAVGLEDGVVAEAFGAALLLGDLSVATAFEKVGFPVEVQRNAGAESRLAIGQVRKAALRLAWPFMAASILSTLS